MDRMNTSTMLPVVSCIPAPRNAVLMISLFVCFLFLAIPRTAHASTLEPWPNSRDTGSIHFEFAGDDGNGGGGDDDDENLLNVIHSVVAPYTFDAIPNRFTSDVPVSIIETGSYLFDDFAGLDTSRRVLETTSFFIVVKSTSGCNTDDNDTDSPTATVTYNGQDITIQTTGTSNLPEDEFVPTENVIETFPCTGVPNTDLPTIETTPFASGVVGGGSADGPDGVIVPTDVSTSVPSDVPTTKPPVSGDVQLAADDIDEEEGGDGSNNINENIINNKSNNLETSSAYQSVRNRQWMFLGLTTWLAMSLTLLLLPGTRGTPISNLFLALFIVATITVASCTVIGGSNNKNKNNRSHENNNSNYGGVISAFSKENTYNRHLDEGVCLVTAEIYYRGSCNLAGETIQVYAPAVRFVALDRDSNSLAHDPINGFCQETYTRNFSPFVGPLNDEGYHAWYPTCIVPGRPFTDSDGSMKMSQITSTSMTTKTGNDEESDLWSSNKASSIHATSDNNDNRSAAVAAVIAPLTNKKQREVTSDATNIRAIASDGSELTTKLSFNQRHQLGMVWSNRAIGEHASIASFASFTIALMSNGAPPSLIQKSLTAAQDELRHATTSFEISSLLLDKIIEPSPLPPSAHQFDNDLTALAIAVAQEGCIDETLSALELASSGIVDDNHDGDDDELVSWINEKTLAIAREEGNHAILAWKTIRWICSMDTTINSEEQEEGDTACTIVQEKVLNETNLKTASIRRFGIETGVTSTDTSTKQNRQRIHQAWGEIYQPLLNVVFEKNKNNGISNHHTGNDDDESELFVQREEKDNEHDILFQLVHEIVSQVSK